MNNPVNKTNITIMNKTVVRRRKKANISMMNNTTIDGITRMLTKPNELQVAKITLNSSSNDIRRNSEQASQHDSRILEQSQDFRNDLEETFNNILPETDFDFQNNLFNPEAINQTIFPLQNEFHDYRKALFEEGTPLKRPVRTYNTSAKTGKKSRMVFNNTIEEIRSDNIADFDIELPRTQEMIHDLKAKGEELERNAITKFNNLAIIDEFNEVLPEFIEIQDSTIEKLNNFHINHEFNEDFPGIENPMVDMYEIETHRQADHNSMAFEQFFKRENFFDEEFDNEDIPNSNAKSRASISSELSSAKKKKLLDENYLTFFLDDGIVPEESAENYMSSLGVHSLLLNKKGNDLQEIPESNELSSYPLSQTDQSINLTDKSMILYNSFSGALKSKKIINFNEAIKKAPKQVKAQSFVELMTLASSGMVALKQNSKPSFGDILVAQLT